MVSTANLHPYIEGLEGVLLTHHHPVGAVSATSPWLESTTRFQILIVKSITALSS